MAWVRSPGDALVVWHGEKESRKLPAYITKILLKNAYYKQINHDTIMLYFRLDYLLQLHDVLAFGDIFCQYKNKTYVIRKSTDSPKAYPPEITSWSPTSSEADDALPTGDVESSYLIQDSSITMVPQSIPVNIIIILHQTNSVIHQLNSYIYLYKIYVPVCTSVSQRSSCFRHKIERLWFKVNGSIMEGLYYQK